jgi:hypothetical protein
LKHFSGVSLSPVSIDRLGYNSACYFVRFANACSSRLVSHSDFKAITAEEIHLNLLGRIGFLRSPQRKNGNPSN